MLPDLSPLKPSIVEAGVNMVIVRELVSGIYFGEHSTSNGVARDVMTYSEDEIRLPVKFAFETALNVKDDDRKHDLIYFCTLAHKESHCCG
jgi:3-isopropylmalate dehydrogenase